MIESITNTHTHIVYIYIYTGRCTFSSASLLSLFFLFSSRTTDERTDQFFLQRSPYSFFVDGILAAQEKRPFRRGTCPYLYIYRYSANWSPNGPPSRRASTYTWVRCDVRSVMSSSLSCFMVPYILPKEYIRVNRSIEGWLI